MGEQMTHPLSNTASGNTFPLILREIPLSRQLSQCHRLKASVVSVIPSLRGSYVLYRNAASLIAIPSRISELSIFIYYWRLPSFRDFMDNVKNGTIRLRASQWPSFLYPHSTIFNSFNRAKGLFRGHVFLRVSFFIFNELRVTDSSAYI